MWFPSRSRTVLLIADHVSGVPVAAPETPAAVGPDVLFKPIHCGLVVWKHLEELR